MEATLRCSLGRSSTIFLSLIISLISLPLTFFCRSSSLSLAIREVLAELKLGLPSSSSSSSEISSAIRSSSTAFSQASSSESEFSAAVAIASTNSSFLAFSSSFLFDLVWSFTGDFSPSPVSLWTAWEEFNTVIRLITVLYSVDLYSST